MKPASFKYERPSTVRESTQLLSDYDGDAKVLAGGQSLVPLLNFRLASPPALIDINSVEDVVECDVVGQKLHVGPVCRHRDIETNSDIMQSCGAIGDAVPQIGHVGIRNRGTVVGSIAHADPSAEWPGLALLLDATIIAQSMDGEHRYDIDGFFEGFMSTGIAPNELITEVTFNLPDRRAGSSWVEFARRQGDFAIVGIGATVSQTDGVISSARLVVTGASNVPSRMPAAEEALRGEPASDAAFAAAGAAAASEVQPISDIHGDASFRRRLVRVLTERALDTAYRRSTNVQ